eukprot:gene45605-37549_t
MPTCVSHCDPAALFSLLQEANPNVFCLHNPRRSAEPWMPLSRPPRDNATLGRKKRYGKGKIALKTKD